MKGEMTQAPTTFGIDFGTTHSCIAYVEAGRQVVVKNAIGEETTPSVVYFQGPEEISALILKERDVVITVPVYFGVAGREATRTAGEPLAEKLFSKVRLLDLARRARGWRSTE
jgi:molecular chaperone DnaK (HSP70)